MQEIDLKDITLEMALNSIYGAARKVEMDANSHDLLKFCHDKLSNFISESAKNVNSSDKE